MVASSGQIVNGISSTFEIAVSSRRLGHAELRFCRIKAHDERVLHSVTPQQPKSKRDTHATAVTI